MSRYIEYYIYGFIYVLLMLPAVAGANTCTSTATGNWSDASKWTSCGGVSPGVGDTAVIANTHNITVNSNVIVGLDGATGTTAVTMNGGSTLTIAAQLNVRGNLLHGRGNSLIFSAGGALVLDSPSAGVRYKLVQTNAIGSGIGTITANGTSWNTGGFVTINGDGGRGGDKGWIDWTSNFSYLNINLAYIKLISLGDATQIGLTNTVISVSTQGTTITNMYADGCGQLHFVNDNNAIPLRLQYIDVRNQLNAVGIYCNATAPTADRYLWDATFYNNSMAADKLVLSCIKGDFRRLALYDTRIGTPAGRGFMVDNSAVFVDDYTINPFSILASTTAGTGVISNSVFLTNDSQKRHIISAFGDSTRTGSISGNLLDGDGVIGYVEVSIGTEKYWTTTNNIFINAAGHVVPSNSIRQDEVITNNTFIGESGIRRGSTTSDSTFVAKNNLFCNSKGLFQQAGYPTSFALPYVLDYNAVYNPPSGYIPYPTGHAYAGSLSYMSQPVNTTWWSTADVMGTTQGVNDKVLTSCTLVNPNWTVRSHMGAASVRDAGREAVKLNGWDYQGTRTTATTYTPSAILLSGRAAFTPINESLIGAGEGGVDIGAVPALKPSDNAFWFGM